MPWAVSWPSQNSLLCTAENFWSEQKWWREWELTPERKTFLIFTLGKKKGINASLLPLPLPAALIVCRGWGGGGGLEHSSSCWPVSWKLPPFSQSQPFLWRRQCGHTVSALCITWAPRPFDMGILYSGSPPPHPPWGTPTPEPGGFSLAFS